MSLRGWRLRERGWSGVEWPDAEEAAADRCRAGGPARDGVAQVIPAGHVDGGVVGHVGEGVARGAVVGGGLEAALAEADAAPEDMGAIAQAEVCYRMNSCLRASFLEGKNNRESVVL